MADDRVLINCYKSKFTHFKEFDLAEGTKKVALAVREGNTVKMVSKKQEIIIII